MTALATVTFEADILIWGASLWGDTTPEVLVAEYGAHYWPSGALWDHGGRRSGTRNGEPLPLWWSLPYVADFLIRTGAA